MNASIIGSSAQLFASRDARPAQEIAPPRIYTGGEGNGDIGGHSALLGGRLPAESMLRFA
jgi:hypothetical protein